MPTLLLRFPGGRYHATPPGHHVNEGLVEWPPSPWRLVRALLATGYATQGWTEVPAAGQRLIDALATTLPEYRLPDASIAHTRHYMPLGVLEKGREKTTLVFDTFADVGEGALFVRWSCALDDEAKALFARLAEHLGYLGRSESWVLAQAIDDDAVLPSQGAAFPHRDEVRPGRGYEQVMLTAAEDPARYGAWRAAELSAALAALPPLPEGKKKPPKKLLDQRAEVEEELPRDLVACLELDTAWWQKRGWSQAPGSRRVLYWREADALELAAPVAPRRPEVPRVEAVLLALTTPSGLKSALPVPARTLPQAELLHRALTSKLGFGNESCPELTGRDEEGKPLRDHQHAHLLPLDLDGDGHLDHILLHAAMGLGPVALRAIRSLKRTYTKGGVGSLQVAIAGHGALEQLRALPAPLATNIARLLGATSGATVWTSATPFVPPRHLKRRGSHTLEGQVVAEVTSRGLPPCEVEVLPWSSDTLPLRHAIRRRRGGAPQPPTDLALALRLRFPEPVRGPVSLGYASHFGLGLFAAENGP